MKSWPTPYATANSAAATADLTLAELQAYNAGIGEDVHRC